MLTCHPRALQCFYAPCLKVLPMPQASHQPAWRRVGCRRFLSLPWERAKRNLGCLPKPSRLCGRVGRAAVLPGTGRDGTIPATARSPCRPSGPLKAGLAVGCGSPGQAAGRAHLWARGKSLELRWSKKEVKTEIQNIGSVAVGSGCWAWDISSL